MTAAKDWPTHLDFRDALNNPSICFDDPDLKGGDVRRDPLGFPRAATGGFASVYRVEKGGRGWAVRCFTSPIPGDAATRYAALSKQLSSANLPYLVPFTFHPQGVRVEGSLYPTVKMAWVDAKPLNAHVAQLVAGRDTRGLSSLQQRWKEMCVRLRSASIAHGDLQHGNVLIEANGQLRLVDYDGMFVPALAGREATELGQPAYQHSRRTKSYFGLDLDRYAALVIYTALSALSIQPALWQQYDNEDNILFTPDDHVDPSSSPLFRDLIKLGKPVDGLASALAAAAVGPIARVPSLDEAHARTAQVGLPAAPRTAISRAPSASRGMEWFQQAAAAESGRGGVHGFAGWSSDIRPVWSRPGTRVIKWTENEPIFSEIVHNEIQVRYPLRRFFRRTEVPVQRTERVQTGTRPITKQRVEHIGQAGLSFLGVTTLGQQAVVLAERQGVRWSLTDDAVSGSAITEFDSGESIGSGGQTVAIAHRAGITVIGSTGVTRNIRREGDSRVYAVAVSPSGQRVAAGLGRQAVTIYDASTSKRLRKFVGFRRKVRAVTFLDEAHVIAGSDDSTVALFSIAKDRRVASARDHTAPVTAVAASPSGDLVASASSDGDVHIYESKNLRSRTAVHLGSEIRTLAFAPDSQHLVVATVEGPIVILNARTGRIAATVRPAGSAGTYAVAGLAFTTTGDLVTAHFNGLLVLWSGDTSRPAIDLTAVRVGFGGYQRPTSSRPPVPGQPKQPTIPVPDCPKCSRQMVARRRNSPPYNRFWGCPSFPRCRGTRSM